jgi:hypothetical protein
MRSAADFPPGVLEFARQLDTGWQKESVLDHIKQLAEEQKFSEAIELIDAELDKGENGAPAALRSQLFELRDEYEASMLTKKLDDALAQEDWAEARRVAREIDGSNAAPAVRTKAREVLNDLNRRRLGLD